jgi:hypothetical protein
MFEAEQFFWASDTGRLADYSGGKMEL